MTNNHKDKRIIVFSCNWHAYSSLESAGIERLAYPATVYPIRLACLGRITPGLILKTFEQGADGVYLIGCPEGECRHNAGNAAAQEVFQEARALLKLLGFAESQLRFAQLEAGDGKGFVADLDVLLTGREPKQGKA